MQSKPSSENKSVSFFDFVKENAYEDPLKLRLQLKQKDYDFDLSYALIQIECRQKTAYKLKNFISNSHFLFPDKISAEQSSHQAVAKFHSSLFNNCKEILDMTAGLGIDALEIASTGAKIKAFELDHKKAKTLSHNAKVFGLNNLYVVNEDSISFLKNTSQKFDGIYIDPARRGESNKRLYNLGDCRPDVIENQNLLRSRAKKILIKASPLLDISQTLKDLKNIESIYVVGVKGECKELLIELNSQILSDNEAADNQVFHAKPFPSLTAINLDNEGKIISHFKSSNINVPIEMASISDITPGSYILEPSAMIMKIAPWSDLSKKYKAKKIGLSSHLFVSTSKPIDFPGRVTQIQKVLKKQDRKSLNGFPASVISKNHPLTSESIRKELNLKEGDSDFIYATRIGDKPIMLLTSSLID